MKQLFIVIFSLIAFSIRVDAQPEKSGTILFESTFDPAILTAANGIKLSSEAAARMPKSSVNNFELKFDQLHASYKQKDGSQKGGRYNGLGVFGGGFSRDYYYNFQDHKLIQAFALNDTLFLMEDKMGLLPEMKFGTGQVVPVIEYIKTDEVKQILGFTCHQVIAKTTVKHQIIGVEKEITEEVTLWYTDELGFSFSPNPVLWTQGAVLAIESKGTHIEAKNIHYKDIKAEDVDLPENGILISQEQLHIKLDLRRKLTRLSRNGSWN
ncbi:hypothetical protein [Pedobacter cryoconitis]|uniref:GLPGLI family protein n=1 Tax=Pedobacter cryoconitis TaxID=188932 RepID=A0A327SVD8_9SPHI|nr:hypothetical protein [Pedobacter cryoconitis]RAJ32941.1 GLPGLI family protein [Pedobacter cryoconitis]